MNKLIFCFDGTCNDPEDAGDFFSDTSISNVLKLHAFFGGKLNPPNGPNSRMPAQRSFYYSGIGTYGGWLRRSMNAAFAPNDGDMKGIIGDARRDLDSNYSDGDEIFIFGFSRGAAIARIFASRIGKAGKKVKFLGVFDTVASMKRPELNPNTFPSSDVLFENGTMGKHIESAVHLVSIDEKRIAFQPTLFNKDSRITEVWFAGVHGDVGGGWWFDGLSDVTLDFMCTRAEAAGLQILDVDAIKYSELQEEDGSDGEGICKDDILIRPRSNGMLHEQHRSKMIAKKTLTSRVVRVNVQDNPATDTAPDNTPIIHHTVCERFSKVVDYRPCALRNLRYRVMDSEGNVGDVRTGIAMLDAT